MKAPLLNRRLMLEAPVRVPDDAGGYSVTWQALGTVWAEVKSATGRETAAGEATLSRASYRITLRAAPFGSPSRPLPDQRFRDGARLFTIEAVTEADPTGRYLVCVAQEERVA